jgi:uncharacterized protein (TIGR04141 family)
VSNLVILQIFSFFGIDVERDLLKSVTGILKDRYSALGARITGRDQVQFTASTSPKDVYRLLDVIIEAYSSDDYKDGAFVWVDHIGEVKDVELVSRLDGKLIARLLGRNLDKIWLSVPEVIDWERVLGFKYLIKRDPVYYDVRIVELLDSIEEYGYRLNIDTLQKKMIYSVDEELEVVKKWSAYCFIYAELYENGRYFILNNGKWYEVNKDYAQVIDEYYKAIPRSQIKLPEYDDDSETDYNARVVSQNPDEYFLLDKKNIKISTSASPVEPCDIFKFPDIFIHVKRYGGSSVLSHLFYQGLVSGELFIREDEFKSELNKRIGGSLHKTYLRNIEHRFSIIYAIISEYDEDLSIPLFSKISIKHAVSRLKALGYHIELAKISVSERKRKTRRIGDRRSRIN